MAGLLLGERKFTKESNHIQVLIQERGFIKRIKRDEKTGLILTIEGIEEEAILLIQILMRVAKEKGVIQLVKRKRESH